MPKEILKDEILTDEELDNVAGGGVLETGYDIQLGGRLGLLNVNPDDTWSLMKFYNNNRGELTDMFAKFGIQFTQRPEEGKNLHTNEYIYNGQKISQDEAWNIIKQKLGK